VVYSNSEPIMRRWKAEHKELVVEVLSERAVLSVRNPAALSSTECAAYPGRITGVFGRDVRPHNKGDQEAEPGPRASYIAMPSCCDPATSSGGTCRSPRGGFR
jgi:hypothetical protein